MKRTTLRLMVAPIAIVFTLGLVAASCSDNGSSNGKSDDTTQNGGGGGGNAASGDELYAKTCASCHGPDAKGLPGLGKDLVTSTFAKGQSDDELVAFLKKGRPASDKDNTTGVDMPPKGGNPALTDDDLHSIVAYLRKLES